MEKDKEYDPAKNWEWNYTSKTEKELKDLAKKMYNNEVFTNYHIPPEDGHLINSIFMTLAMIGPGMNSEGRESAIDMVLEEEYYNKWIDNIGMVYEDISKASPRGINGYPMFFSNRMLDKEDTKKVLDYYKKYEKLQKSLEDEF